MLKLDSLDLGFSGLGHEFLLIIVLRLQRDWRAKPWWKTCDGIWQTMTNKEGRWQRHTTTTSQARHVWFHKTCELAEQGRCLLKIRPLWFWPAYIYMLIWLFSSLTRHLRPSLWIQKLLQIHQGDWDSRFILNPSEGLKPKRKWIHLVTEHTGNQAGVHLRTWCYKALPNISQCSVQKALKEIAWQLSVQTKHSLHTAWTNASIDRLRGSISSICLCIVELLSKLCEDSLTTVSYEQHVCVCCFLWTFQKLKLLQGLNGCTFS